MTIDMRLKSMNDYMQINLITNEKIKWQKWGKKKEKK